MESITKRRAISRIIVALEDCRGALPTRELVTLRVQGLRVEDAATALSDLNGVHHQTAGDLPNHRRPGRLPRRAAHEGIGDLEGPGIAGGGRRHRAFRSKWSPSPNGGRSPESSSPWKTAAARCPRGNW